MMTNLEVASSAPSVGTYLDDIDIEGLFRARYLEMVRLTGLPTSRPAQEQWSRQDWCRPGPSAPAYPRSALTARQAGWAAREASCRKAASVAEPGAAQ